MFFLACFTTEIHSPDIESGMNFWPLIRPDPTRESLSRPGDQTRLDPVSECSENLLSRGYLATTMTLQPDYVTIMNMHGWWDEWCGKNRFHNLWVQIKANLTKIHHSFATNSATRNTAVKPWTGSKSGSDILTRDLTQPDPAKIVDPVTHDPETRLEFCHRRIYVCMC